MLLSADDVELLDFMNLRTSATLARLELRAPVWCRFYVL